MMRLMPWDDPIEWGMSNRSRPSTLWPRRANWKAVALPMPPMPTTMTSYIIRIPPIEKTRLGRRLEPISYHPIFCGFRQCDKFFYRGSDCRDYFMRRPVALVIERQLLAEI